MELESGKGTAEQNGRIDQFDVELLIQILIFMVRFWSILDFIAPYQALFWRSDQELKQLQLNLFL